MKLYCGLLSCLALGLAVLVSQGETTQPIKITWIGNLAKVEWTEPLADAKVGKNEIAFSILSGPSIGWLQQAQLPNF